MTISYKWLSEYLPDAIDPERLSKILTSIGLEVEHMLRFEEARGGLKGLVIGEVLTTEKHPNADKLKLTTVNTGGPLPLNIVCGAPNVEPGQKVVIAPVGATIYPTNGEPVTMKLAKIRGSESQGMICAEDEIGMGDSHAGILVLPQTAVVGTPAPEYFQPYDDYIYEIGLTPNRMDAMSHWGVARDVCAYLSHHDRKDTRPKIPNSNGFRSDNQSLTFSVRIENEAACPRYSGLSISGVTIGESPRWLQQRLKAIGVRPINNIVDITNYIQHETGQPLHAFDADKITDHRIIVKNLPEGTPFRTLDEKERKLHAEDLMICDPAGGLCMAGVFGGAGSGVSQKTKAIFLESAFFEGIGIRKTSFRHGLRTDAATRFEKGTDISATVNVLKRAAMLIKEICGGEISSDVIDLYPDKREKEQVSLKYHFLKKLSGKNYHPDAVRNILTSLGFEIAKEGIDELRVLVPYNKPDISLPADLVEEVLRIDGLDNVEIPDSITITPSSEDNYAADTYKEKTAGYLVGLGFFEIMTNSITNSAYFSDAELETGVKMLNSLSAELNLLRPSMLETGLESVAHNLNRRNDDLRFFEFGKTYSRSGPDGNATYQEAHHLGLYVTGANLEEGWRAKPVATDFYTIKGITARVLDLLGVRNPVTTLLQDPRFEEGMEVKLNGQWIARAGRVSRQRLAIFGIKQPVFFADLNWTALSALAVSGKAMFTGIPKYPAVQRDLALVVPKTLAYSEVEAVVNKIRVNQLQQVKLFDVFESEKLGAGKKSLAVNFLFQDQEKTLTDKEIDSWMNKITGALEKELQAEIRK